MMNRIFLFVFKVFIALLQMIFVPIFFFVSCLKLAVIKIWYRFVVGKPFKILFGSDAFVQVHGKPYFTTHDCISMTHFILCLNGRLDVSQWRECVQQKLIMSPTCPDYASMFSKLTHKITKKCNYYIWEQDDKFSVEHHVRQWPHSYDDDTSLMNIVCKLYHQPLPKDHSPWEFVLIAKKCSNGIASEIQSDVQENSYAVVLRIHHSLADGSLILMILAALSDSQQWFQETFDFDAANLAKAPPLIKYNEFLQYLASRKRGVKLTVKRTVLIAYNLLCAIVAILYYDVNCLFDEEKNNLHGPPLVGRKLMAITEPLDLKLFKDITKELKCTINDIFVSCSCGAVQTEDPSISNIKLYFMLGGMMPGTLGTQNTLSKLSIKTNISEKCPISRLKILSKDLISVMSSSLSLGLIIGLTLTCNHLPMFLQSHLADILNGTFDTTNLRGPPLQVKINGHLVTDASLLSMNTGRSMGVSFSIFSYNGYARIGVLIDRAVASDDHTAKRLADSVVTEFHKLYSIVQRSEL